MVRYHGEVEDPTHWTQCAGLSEESLCSLQRADIIGGHQHFHASTLPFTHSLRLVT